MAILDSSTFDEVDAFAAYDAAAGRGLDIDLHPVLAGLRRRGPILPVDLHDVLGIDKSVMITGQAGGYLGWDVPIYSALSFDAVDKVLRDSSNFSQEVHRRSYEHTVGRAINTMDAPEHRLHRSLVEQAFTRGSMKSWAADIIAPLAHRRAADLLARGRDVDLLSEFTFWYPGEVITSLLGLPEDDIPRFMRVATAMTNHNNPPLARYGAEVMTEWISSTLQERRAEPGGGDVLSLLLRAEIDGQRLTDDEIADFVRLLFPAGFETTFRALSNLMVGLLSTGQWELLKEDRSLIPQAVEEGLRWEGPVLGHPRYAIHDVEVCGVAIPEGAVIHAFHSSANRDETRWERPEEFDILRPLKSHSTFGFGPHLCLGKNLARVESIAALEAFLDTFPNIHLSPDATEEDLRIRGLVIRAPERIPVTLT
jgi:cytochrome P450